MIAVGIRSYFLGADTVAAGLVTGGVSLISIILTAYVGAATWQDINLWKPEDNHDELP
jgi:putative Mn2+ efflux pump MntP